MTVSTQATAISRPSGPPLQAYQAVPEGAGPFPGLIVIREIFGQNEPIHQMAGRLAGQGYAAEGAADSRQRTRTFFRAPL